MSSRPNSKLVLNGSPAVDGSRHKTFKESSGRKLLSDLDKRLKLASLACDESSMNALSRRLLHSVDAARILERGHTPRLSGLGR